MVQFHQAIDHLPFALGDTSHIYSQLASNHPQPALGIDERNRLGAIDHILAWQAGNVGTRPANHRAFDDDRFLALFRQVPGQYLPRFATANDDVLIMFDGHDSPLIWYRHDPHDRDQ